MMPTNSAVRSTARGSSVTASTGTPIIPPPAPGAPLPGAPPPQAAAPTVSATSAADTAARIATVRPGRSTEAPDRKDSENSTFDIREENERVGRYPRRREGALKARGCVAAPSRPVYAGLSWIRDDVLSIFLVCSSTPTERLDRSSGRSDPSMDVLTDVLESIHTRTMLLGRLDLTAP